MTAPQRHEPSLPAAQRSIDHDLRERLDALQSRRSRRASGTSTPAPTAPPCNARAVESLGGHELSDDCGACWVVETAVESARPRDARGAAGAKPPCRQAPALLVDIETGGFSGTPVFLIGILPLDGPSWTIVQWLARDYPEEEAILRRFAAAARGRHWVSFNGRAFDGPFLHERAARYGILLEAAVEHTDLLHVVRRRWKGELADCRLETVERVILGRERRADVPGALIPDLFHHFCRSGNAAPLAGVLEHNRRDLVACFDLWCRCAADVRAGSAPGPKPRSARSRSAIRRSKTG